jgi:multicomponent K+:H+ antiporter subunit E
VLARLVLRVGGDVVVSALQVAGGVLRPAPAAARRLRAPCRSTCAMRTGWRRWPSSRRWCPARCGPNWRRPQPLLIHVFDVEDEAAFIANYKARYELPLKEIFE